MANRSKLPRSMSRRWWRLILKRKDGSIFGGYGCPCCPQVKSDGRGRNA